MKNKIEMIEVDVYRIFSFSLLECKVFTTKLKLEYVTHYANTYRPQTHLNTKTMFTTRESVFLSMECRTLLNTNERVYIGLKISLIRLRSNPYTWLHPIPSLVTE